MIEVAALEDTAEYAAVAQTLREAENRPGWPGWVCAPAILAAAKAGAGVPYPAARPLSTTRVRRELARSEAAALAVPAIPGMFSSGRTAFVAGTLNQRRVQEPVARRLGGMTKAPRWVRPGPRRAAALAGEAARSCNVLLEALDERGLGVPGSPLWAMRGFLASARFLAWAEAMLRRLRPESLVLGSMHGGEDRAMVIAARRAGIPTIYLPHAPVLSEPLLNDLPVTNAGLRGELELAYFERLGADRGRLQPVGNPALEPLEMPAIDRSLPPVFAPSPENRPLLEWIASAVGEGIGPEAIVAPHPRSDRSQLRALLPPGWRLWEGRTYELLRLGPPAVIQHSSGVALEAMQLGIPVVELSVPGRGAGYPLIREPEVRICARDQLAGAVAAARRDAGERSRRERLVAWSRQWCWPLGAASADRCAELIRAVSERAPGRGPIWDGWAEPPEPGPGEAQ